MRSAAGLSVSIRPPRPTTTTPSSRLSSTSRWMSGPLIGPPARRRSPSGRASCPACGRGSPASPGSAPPRPARAAGLFTRSSSKRPSWKAEERPCCSLRRSTSSLRSASSCAWPARSIWRSATATSCTARRTWMRIDWRRLGDRHLRAPQAVARARERAASPHRSAAARSGSARRSSASGPARC